MNKQLNTPLNSLTLQDKDSENYLNAQLIRFYNYLKENVVTCTMASNELAIPQKSLTRYKRTLEQSGLLWQVKKAKCLHTRFQAWYLTTNAEHAPIGSIIQLNLFEHGE